MLTNYKKYYFSWLIFAIVPPKEQKYPQNSKQFFPCAAYVIILENIQQW